MPFFRKKPVVIEAIQNNDDATVEAFLGAENRNISWGRNTRTGEVMINTLEGMHRANPGDWLIKGVAGEFYPCKPDIFAATYEAADD